MYSDIALIRRHRVNLSFNDREAKLIESLCDFTGQEKAAFLRELILDRVKDVLHTSQSGESGGEMRDAQGERMRA